MEIQPLGKRRLLIYLSGDELDGYPSPPSDMKTDDAATLLKSALGEEPDEFWDNVLLEMFAGDDSLLLFARAHSGEPHFFIFKDLEELITAAKLCPVDVISTLSFADEKYYLVVYPWDKEAPPAVLSEYSCPETLHPFFALHLSEHGKTLLGPAAIDDLKELF